MLVHREGWTDLAGSLCHHLRENFWCQEHGCSRHSVRTGDVYIDSLDNIFLNMTKPESKCVTQQPSRAEVVLSFSSVSRDIMALGVLVMAGILILVKPNRPETTKKEMTIIGKRCLRPVSRVYIAEQQQCML